MSQCGYMYSSSRNTGKRTPWRSKAMSNLTRQGRLGGGGGREVQRKIFHTPIWAASCIPIPSILFDENTIPRPTRRHRHTQPTQMQSRWTRRQPKAEQIISRRGTLCLYPHENTQVHSSSRVSVYSIIDSLCSYRLPALLTCILCGRIDGHLLTPSCLKSVQAITRRYV